MAIAEIFVLSSLTCAAAFVAFLISSWVFAEMRYCGATKTLESICRAFDWATVITGLLFVFFFLASALAVVCNAI